MTWFGLIQISYSCQKLSVDGACLSLATFVMPTPVKTILELFRHALAVLDPKDWRRRTGRPIQIWLRTVEDDLRPLNFSPATVRRHALDRSSHESGYVYVTCSRERILGLHDFISVHVLLGRPLLFFPSNLPSRTIKALRPLETLISSHHAVIKVNS